MESIATADYLGIVAHYENCLQRHGDTHRGVDWPDADEAAIRYDVMLDAIRELTTAPVRLLDLGCGAGHLLEHLDRNGRTGIDYAGLDMSPKFIELCRSKFPQHAFYCADILSSDVALPQFDYVLLNGVLTEKCELSHEAMWTYARRLLARAFDLADIGIAFNVMSKLVDWERGDLFHMAFDEMARFVSQHLSRHFQFRCDYGLYEYTVYVYRNASFADRRAG